MNRVYMGVIAGAAGALALLLLLIVAIGGNSAQAGATSVDQVAADMDPTGNVGIHQDDGGPTNSAGTVDPCGSIMDPDGILEFDLVVKGVPPFTAASGGSGGIGGFSLTLNYDNSLLNVVNPVDRTVAMWNLRGGSAFTTGTNPRPDTDGAFTISHGILSPEGPDGNTGTDDDFSSGDGILIRLHVQRLGTATGTSPINLTVVKLIASTGADYTNGTVTNGTVEVGGPCGDTPVPTTPAPTSPPVTSPGQTTPPVTDSPTPTDTPTPTITAVPTSPPVTSPGQTTPATTTAVPTTPAVTTPPAGDFEFGNVNCSPDGDPDSTDALVVLQDTANLPLSIPAGCPGPSAIVDTTGTGEVTTQDIVILGDVNCDGSVNSVDALVILLYVANLPFSQQPNCPALGSPAS